MVVRWNEDRLLVAAAMSCIISELMEYTVVYLAFRATIRPVVGDCVPLPSSTWD